MNKKEWGVYISYIVYNMWCNGNNNRVIDSVNDNKERVYVKKKIFFHDKGI